MDPSLILGIVLAGFAGLGGLAGTAGYLKSTAAKSRSEALRADIDDWSNRYNALKADLVEEVHKREAAEHAQVTLTVRINALEVALSGRKDFEEISRVLKEHDKRAQRVQVTLDKVVRHIGIQP